MNFLLKNHHRDVVKALSLPYLIPKTSAPRLFSPWSTGAGPMECQVLRSACDWSVGSGEVVETSILSAMVHAINNAEHFIYIGTSLPHSLSPSHLKSLSPLLPPPPISIYQQFFRESIFHWYDGRNRSLESISRGYLSENRAGNLRTSSLSSHCCPSRPSGWYVI